jgi:ATP/maltotriose-dependent transcriptional regulator MalT
LRWFWWHRCHYEEGSRWLQAALELFADDAGAAETDREAALARARALSAAGHLAWGQGNYGRATALLEAGLAQARLLGDDRECAYGLSHLAAVAVNRGESARAEQLSWQAIEHCRAAGATWQQALSLYWLAFAARAQGDLQRAAALQQQSLALRRELGDTWGTAWSLHLLGRVAMANGELERAEALLTESLDLHRQIDHQRGIAWCLVDLGLLARARDQHPRAAELLRESLRLTRVQGDRSTLARCLEALAGLALDGGRPGLAVRLLGAAETLRAAIQAPLAPADRPAQEQTLAALSRLLGRPDLEAALAEGRQQPLEAAVEAALGEPLKAETPEPSGKPAASPAGLSARELEVLRLLAEGSSNQEIADRLVLSVSTVERHLTHIYTKIGARGRAEAATFASRHGLLDD